MKKYTTPELEIIAIELEDVLTISDGGSTDGLQSGVGGWY